MLKTVSSINGEVVEKIMLDKEMLTVVWQSAPGIHLPRNRYVNRRTD
ncbi:hypothetical protein [Bacillus sp. es.036]|nr:hypothetical protein [Bacillus sp. es.036]